MAEPDESYCLFGAKALLKRLQSTAKEINGVRSSEDIESIHDMRVATRRVRSALQLFGECLPDKKLKSWNKDIRYVTKALGTARDKDVQIDFLQGFLKGVTESNQRPGIQRLLLRLRQDRERLQARVLKAMDRLEQSKALEEMGTALRRIRIQARMHHANEHSPYVYQQAFLAISLRLENMLAYEPYITQPERIEELHAMRIGAKRLRYTMEVFEPLYQDNVKEVLKVVRQIQTTLGDIHDCDVWVAHLPQFMEEEKAHTLEYFGHTRSLGRLKPGIVYLQEERQEKRDGQYREFIEFWQHLQEQNIWDNLLEMLAEPLPEPVEPDTIEDTVH